jgi:hypothetical protein
MFHGQIQGKLLFVIQEKSAQAKRTGHLIKDVVQIPPE